MRVSGPPRDYIEVSDTLPTIRGRIDIAEQLRRRQLQPQTISCGCALRNCPIFLQCANVAQRASVQMASSDLHGAVRGAAVYLPLQKPTAGRS
jgi:hypothetical protein